MCLYYRSKHSGVYLQLKGGNFDEKYVVSSRVRTGRSIRGLCLPPAACRAERREVERVRHDTARTIYNAGSMAAYFDFQIDLARSIYKLMVFSNLSIYILRFTMFMQLAGQYKVMPATLYVLLYLCYNMPSAGANVMTLIVLLQYTSA